MFDQDRSNHVTAHQGGDTRRASGEMATDVALEQRLLVGPALVFAAESDGQAALRGRIENELLDVRAAVHCRGWRQAVVDVVAADTTTLAAGIER